MQCCFLSHIIWSTGAALVVLAPGWRDPHPNPLKSGARKLGRVFQSRPPIDGMYLFMYVHVHNTQKKTIIMFFSFSWCLEQPLHNTFPPAPIWSPVVMGTTPRYWTKLEQVGHHRLGTKLEQVGKCCAMASLEQRIWSPVVMGTTPRYWTGLNLN